jgi:hypothetical protein
VNIERDEKFSRHHMVELAPDDLRSRVTGLDDTLNRILDYARDRYDEDVFQAGMDRKIVQALQRRGHDLWGSDFDGGNIERWSYDYTSEEARSLVLDIHRHWKVRCDWIEMAPDSGERCFILGVCDLKCDRDERSEE